MVQPKIVFYYDVISPFSLFAFKVLQRYQPLWNFELIFKPAFLGGVMATSKNSPPANVVNKGIHMRKFDLPMTSAYFKIPYKFPTEFPVNTINIIRFLRVVQDEAPEKLEALTEIFFEGMWGVTGDATYTAKPQNFSKLIPASILSVEKLNEYLKKAGSNENKDRVKNESVDLASEGFEAFGFPWMEVTNSKGKTVKFFGSDRFEIMADFLGVKWNGPCPTVGAKL